MVPFSVAGLAAALVVWEVKPPGREPIPMFVPLALVPVAEVDQKHVITELSQQHVATGAVALVDAVSLDGFVRAWINLHLQGADASLPKLLQPGHTEQLRRSGLHPGGTWPIRHGSAEQSNTSVRVGERAILKVIRKLEAGTHPELEVGRYLTEAGFTGTPPLLGWMQSVPSPGESATLSVLQTFVPNQGDGWSWVQERLAVGVREDEAGAWSESLDWLQTLARRTAELHRLLAADTAAGAFSPEAVQPYDLQLWADAGLSMATRAVQAIAADGSGSSSHSIELARALRARKSLVERSLRSLAEMEPDFAKTRHHGDFHLGQTLVCGSDAMIIDFEGEPMRPLPERRAKHCVLRDVAGMLRSFSYAAAAAERALPPDWSNELTDKARVRLYDWEQSAAERFVRTYFSVAQGIPSLPARREHAETLLRFFLLEKALYELVYEKANRPDWMDIPLRGVLNLLRAAGS